MLLTFLDIGGTLATVGLLIGVVVAQWVYRPIGDRPEADLAPLRWLLRWLAYAFAVNGGMDVWIAFAPADTVLLVALRRFIARGMIAMSILGFVYRYFTVRLTLHVAEKYRYRWPASVSRLEEEGVDGGVSRGSEPPAPQ
jgi:hypothetical protein